MNFYATLFAAIVILTFISRYFDYHKAKMRAQTKYSGRSDLEAIRAELASMRERLADVLLELDRQSKLPPASGTDVMKAPPND